MKEKVFSILALLCITASSAWAQTSDDIGRVIAADGKMYKTVTLANKVSTASGVVAYVGTAGSVDGTAASSTHKVIAISLVNLPGGTPFCTHSGLWFSQAYTNLGDCLNVIDGLGRTSGLANSNSAGADHDNGGLDGPNGHLACKAAWKYDKAQPSGASNWFLPTIGQWNLVVKGLMNRNTDIQTSQEAAISHYALNEKLTPCGAEGFPTGANYWTTTEYNGDNVWTFRTYQEGSNAIQMEKTSTVGWTRIRPFFTFASASNGYVVEYDANGGSGAPAAQSKTNGTALTLSSTVPTRTGYTFAGWATSADGAVAYAAGASYETDNDVVLYAQWTPIASYNVTANSASEAYWATFYSNAGNYQAAEGTQVFTVSLAGTGITMHEVSDRIAKSGQGVVLKKTTTGNFTMTLTETAPAGDFSGNSLTGTMTVINTTGANDYYVLGGKSGAGFYKLSNTSGTIGANKAYLTYSGGGAAAARGFFLFDETTGIEMPTAEDNDNADAVVFDLQGRRVLNPTKGLYIVNGKKVFINK